MTDQQLSRSIAISVCRICFSAMIFFGLVRWIFSVQPVDHLVGISARGRPRLLPCTEVRHCVPNP